MYTATVNLAHPVQRKTARIAKRSSQLAGINHIEITYSTYVPTLATAL